MKKHRRLCRLSDLAASRALLSAGWGILVILVIVLLFSYILTKTDLPESVVSAVTACALCAGAYAGGYVCAKKNRRCGLLMGMICGGIIFLVLFVASLILVRSAEGTSGGGKLILVLLFGAVGGIVGVNGRSKRY
ncbi:MAG: TIGR04086 family membrane protein [Ruminococcus sp.]|nr:TIGR04086 family membrane protein [Ruminococcus sp.]